MTIYPVLTGNVDSEGSDKLDRVFKTYNAAMNYVMRRAHDEAVERTNESDCQHAVSVKDVKNSNNTRVTVHPDGCDADWADYWWLIIETELVDD
jgi:hypothetical protein